MPIDISYVMCFLVTLNHCYQHLCSMNNISRASMNIISSITPSGNIEHNILQGSKTNAYKVELFSGIFFLVIWPFLRIFLNV